MKSKFRLHVEEWKDCVCCEYSKHRKQVVFARGKIPCDVLFVGEAPGESENVIGQPFVGPAGKVLDHIVHNTCGNYPEVRVAFTNMIGCIPYDEDQQKVSEPEEDAIQSCKPRLQQFIELAQPKIIVAVGKVAETWLEQGFQHSVKLPNPKPKVVAIMHPAAILRINVTLQGMQVQKCKITVNEALEELFVKE